MFAGQDIDKSPFLVNVAKALGDPNKVQARGPGLDPVGNVVHKPTYFDIYTAGESHTQCDAPLCTRYRRGKEGRRDRKKKARKTRFNKPNLNK